MIPQNLLVAVGAATAAHQAFFLRKTINDHVGKTAKAGSEEKTQKNLDES